jgi:hypothetical protein
MIETAGLELVESVPDERGYYFIWSKRPR